MPPVNPISLPTPMFRRTTPPRKGAKPETVAPSRFSTPTAEARTVAGTTSNAAAAWFPEIHPERIRKRWPRSGLHPA